MNSPRRLLVVDDEPSDRDLIARRLQRAGFEVRTAATAEAALRLLRGTHVDLVLLDQMMPGMSGLEMLKLVRATHSPSELPVIMVTALSDSETVVDALNCGANDHIAKPVDFPVALARIAAWLRRQEEVSAATHAKSAETRRSGEERSHWEWDLQCDRVTMVDSYWEKLGQPVERNNFHMRDWLELMHPADRDDFELRTASAQSDPQAGFVAELRLRLADHTYCWVLMRGRLRHGNDGAPESLAATLIDITESKSMDPLTGLSNRLHFLDQANRRLMSESEPRSYAIVVLDINRFRLVNDSLGYSAGDRLLWSVGFRLRAAIRVFGGDRPNDCLARIDADRFGILLSGVKERDTAVRVAARILGEIRQPFHVEGRELFVTASAGIVLPDGGYGDASAMLHFAETALHRAKSADNGDPVVFEPWMRHFADVRLRMEMDLRRALELGQFTIYYQPKVDLITGGLAGFEALLRWNHPTEGLIAPAKFLPLLEESGLILEVGRWVLEESCRTLKEWQQELANQHLAVSVNVSVHQLRGRALLQDIRDALAASGLPPASLRLEVTETALMADLAAAHALLNEVKALGVGLEIDDFGTGYSSLAYLAKLPFDWLKIDRSFVQDLCENRQSEQLTRTLIGLAQGLGLGVIAEGVETEAQARRLRELGCPLGQGFLFARPLPAADAIAYARARLHEAA
jgi:diguanylate cyclase (GGDEF)-like protein